MHLVFSDGRLALRLEDRRFDVIEADALEPWMANSGNLYSKEFFELCLSRLKPGGIVCTYVPTERTRRTAIAAFPYVLSFDLSGAPGFILGSRQPILFNRQACLAWLASESAQRYIARSGFSSLQEQVLEYFNKVEVKPINGAERQRIVASGEDINTDLFPRDEYGRTHASPLF